MSPNECPVSTPPSFNNCPRPDEKHKCGDIIPNELEQALGEVSLLDGTVYNEISTLQLEPDKCSTLQLVTDNLVNKQLDEREKRKRGTSASWDFQFDISSFTNSSTFDCKEGEDGGVERVHSLFCFNGHLPPQQVHTTWSVKKSPGLEGSTIQQYPNRFYAKRMYCI